MSTAATSPLGTTAEAPPAPAFNPLQQVTLGLADAFTTQNAVTIIVPPRELAHTRLGRALPIDWDKIQATGGREGDVILRDGDIVYVPTQPTLVLVAGAVQNQGPLRYERGMKVQDAINQAGGPGKDAVLRSAIVIRVNGQTKPARMKDPVLPGDIVIVPTQYITQVVRSQSTLERALSALASLALTFRFLY